MKIIRVVFFLLLLLQLVYCHENHTEIESFKCISSIESCSNMGFCSAVDKSKSKSKCLCFESHTTHDCPNSEQCCYRKKSQSTAMFLHFLFGLIGGRKKLK